MNSILDRLRNLLALLGLAGAAAVVVALVFFAGEIRELLRQPGATPGTPVVLQDSHEVEDTPTRVVGPCETGQGLEVLEPQAGERAEWEERFGRDLDGDGRVGAPAAPPEPAAEDGLGDVDVPSGFLGLGEASQLGEEVLLRQVLTEADAGERGGEFLVTFPAGGGKAIATWVANEVPKKEWLHELRGRALLGLPAAGDQLGDRWRLEADWFPARWRSTYFGLRGEFEGRHGETDAAVLALVEFRCRGLGDCEPR